MANGFGKLKPKTGNSDGARLDELVDMINFSDYANEFVDLRFIDKPIIAVKIHWVKIYAKKTKKEVSIPKYCLKHNPENEDVPKEDVTCPWCDLPHGKDKPAHYQFFYLANAIVRELQEDEPRRKAKPTKSENKTGFKDAKSKSWTPVRVVRVPSSVAARIQELGELNIVKKGGKKKAFDVSHDKYGVDVKIKYKPEASGTDKYSADKDDEKSPLTEDEKGYLTYNLCDALLDAAGRGTEEQAIEELKRMELVGGEDIEEDDDDGIDLGGKKKKKKSKAKSAFDDEEDDDDLDDDDEDDDEDEPKRISKSKKKKKSSSKKSSKKKKKRKSSDDDDDDAPKKKKKKKSSTKTKKKASSKKRKKKFDDEEDDIPF